jgi:hypothetical protein
VLQYLAPPLSQTCYFYYALNLPSVYTRVEAAKITVDQAEQNSKVAGKRGHRMCYIWAFGTDDTQDQQ